MRAYIRDTAHEKDLYPRSPRAKSHSACPPLAGTTPPDERALSPPNPQEAASSSYFRSYPPGSAPAPRDRREDWQKHRGTARQSPQTSPQPAAPPCPHH